MFDRQRRKNRPINSTYPLYSPTSQSPSNTKNALSKICDPPIQCQPSTSISDAVSIMKDKRTHCLIINDAITGKLLGLVTTKDLAFRVVVNNLNSSKTSIDTIMTENPYFVSQFTSANEALKLMVDKKIRHLPLVDDGGIVTGMLNITTCFYHAMIRLEKMSEEVKELQCTFEDLKATDNNNINNTNNNNDNNTNELEFSKYSLVNHSVLSPKIEIEIENEKSKINIDTIDLIALNEGLIDLDISTRKNKIVNDLKTLIEIMKQPDLKSLLNDNDLNIKSPVLIDSKTSILDAARILVNFNVTSALIVNNINNYQIGNVIGIFTTKDLVFRVLNCEIDSRISKVVRIMTPKPDFADESTGIHTALRLMYEGKYLNLPIKNSTDQIIGLVNVLQLTYALLKTLEMSNINDNNNDDNFNNYNNQHQDSYLSKATNPDISSDFLTSVYSDLETSGPAWNRFWGSLEKPLSTIPRHSRHSTTSLDVRRFGNYHRTTSFASFVSEPPIVKIENGNESQTGNEIEKKVINSNSHNKSLSDLKVIAMSTTSEFSDSTASRLGISTSKELMMDKKVMIKLKIKEQNGLNLGIHGKIYKFNIVIKEITDSSNYNILKFIKDKLRKRLKILNQDSLKFEIGYFDEDGDLVSVERNEDIEIALEGNYKSLVLICHLKRKNNNNEVNESIHSGLTKGDSFSDIDFRIIVTLLAGGIIFGGSLLLKYIANKR